MLVGDPPQPAGDGDPQRLKVWIESIPLMSGSMIKPTPSGVTAIVGANNCGKTTLLNEVNTLLTNPYSGMVSWKVSAGTVGIRQAGSRDDLLAWLNEHASWGIGQHDHLNGPAFRRENLSFELEAVDRWESRPISHAGFWTRYFPPEGYGQIYDAERLPVGTAPNSPTQIFYERPRLMEELSAISEEIFNRPLTLDDESNMHRLLLDRPSVPRPLHSEDRRAYRTALANLETLSQQGHGMRSWLSIITQLIAGTYPIVIADEPEVFLHPPLARSLGRYLGKLARERNSQVILATHDRHLLTGLLEGSEAFSVVRLVRTPERTDAHQLVAEDVAYLWKDPVLRYSDVLDGLFHQAVIVAEAHGDCTFYRAAADHLTSLSTTDSIAGADDRPSDPVKVSEIMFVPSNGKQGIPKFVRALNAIKVPVVVTPDFDVLNPKDTALENIVKALGSDDDWARIKALLAKATASLVRPTAFSAVQLVAKTAADEFEQILQENPNAVWDPDTKARLNGVLRAASGPSEILKDRGVNFASGQEKRDLDELLNELATLGIVPAHVGELEKFDRDVDQKNKTKWLEAALAKQAYTSQEAQQHIRRCLLAARRLLPEPQHAATSQSGVSRDAS